MQTKKFDVYSKANEKKSAATIGCIHASKWNDKSCSVFINRKIALIANILHILWINFPFIMFTSLFSFLKCTHGETQHVLVTCFFFFIGRGKTSFQCIIVCILKFIFYGFEYMHTRTILSIRHQCRRRRRRYHCLRSLPIHKSAGSSHLFCIQHLYRCRFVFVHCEHAHCGFIHNKTHRYNWHLLLSHCPAPSCLYINARCT